MAIRTVEIAGKQVSFKASAAIPRIWGNITKGIAKSRKQHIVKRNKELERTIDIYSSAFSELEEVEILFELTKAL